MLNRAPLPTAQAGLIGFALIVGSLSGCSNDATGPSQPLPPPNLAGTMIYYSNGETFAFELSTETIRQLPDDFPSLGPGGTTYSTDAYQSMRVIDLASGATLDSFYIPDFGAELQRVTDHKLSPDGKRLAVTGYGPVFHGRSQVVVIDLSTGEWAVRGYFDYSDGGTTIPSVTVGGWLPDGSGLILMASEFSRLNFPHTLNRVFKLLVPYPAGNDFIGPLCRDCTYGLDISHDGRTIAYGNDSGTFGFMSIDGTPATGFPNSIVGINPIFSPNDSLVAFERVAGDSAIKGIYLYRFSDRREWKLIGWDGAAYPSLIDWE